MLVAGTEGGGAGDVVPFVLTQDVVNDNNDDDYGTQPTETTVNLFCFPTADIWK